MSEVVEGYALVGQRMDRRPGEAPEDTVSMSRIKSFTRRTRELPANLARTWEAHAHRYVVEPYRGIGYTTVVEDLMSDLAKSFGRSTPVTLGIGLGTGEQIVATANAYPERNFLALEVWVPGIAKLVSKAVEAGVDNIRVIEADAAQTLSIMLEDVRLDEVWISFPDPWRKARHCKRRLVSGSFACEVVRLLRDGGMWCLVTDQDDYARQMRDVTEVCEFFENPHAEERPDPEDPQPWRGGSAPCLERRVVAHLETQSIDAGRHVHDIVDIRRLRG